MDEYIGITKEHPESYHSLIHNFFNHIDIQPQNINILNNNTDDHDGECRRYEEKNINLMAKNSFIYGAEVLMDILPLMNLVFFKFSITRKKT